MRYIQAIIDDDVGQMKELISEGISPRAKNAQHYDYDCDFGKELIHFAAEHGSLQVLRFLVGNGADVDCTFYLDYANPHYSPLIYASENNHTEMCKYLVEQGASVNINDQEGYQPLQGAVEERNIELVRLYVEHGANENHILHSIAEAGMKGDLETYHYLVDKIDINKTTLRGRNALLTLFFRLKCLAADQYSAHTLTIVSDLLERGADVSQKDKQGATALEVAGQMKNGEIAGLLEG